MQRRLASDTCLRMRCRYLVSHSKQKNRTLSGNVNATVLSEYPSRNASVITYCLINRRNSCNCFLVLNLLYRNARIRITLVLIREVYLLRICSSPRWMRFLAPVPRSRHEYSLYSWSHDAVRTTLSEEDDGTANRKCVPL